MSRQKIESIDLRGMAENVRQIADEIEKGGFVAFAMVGCGEDGTASQACMVNSNFATHDLLDEMVHEIKRTLFESYEA